MPPRDPAVPVGVRPAVRATAYLIAGVLALPSLAACGSADDAAGAPAAAQDIAAAERDLIADGGKAAWAVDALPETFNSFQSDADPATARIAGAVLPSMYDLDERGRAVRNADYLESAEIIEREPKQVVLYKLNQQAVWSDGREIGAADFAAQWRALSGEDSAFWTARNAGYDRIEKIEKGANNLEVRVTFEKPYTDWRSLFSPLYPKDVMGTPDAFNDGARKQLKATAGPFRVAEVDRKAGELTLTRNPRWWGRPAKLEKMVLKAVPREDRAEALAAGQVDIAEVTPDQAERIALAAREKGASGPLAHGPGAELTPAKALNSWAIANDPENEERAEAMAASVARTHKAIKKYAKEQQGLRGFVIRKSLEPAYTQLALNGSGGPLADERVRRAVARALDREELARIVLKPLGLPVNPVGSHVALAGQEAYSDNSGAIGDQDTAEARALLADAGWVQGGPVKTAGSKADKKKAAGSADEDGTYIVGQEDGKPRADTDFEVRADNQPEAKAKRKEEERAKKDAHRGGAPGAYAPKGTAAPKPAGGPLAKDGEALNLKFVLPSGPGSEQLRAVGEGIQRMLQKVGIRTEITKVPDDSYFKDHIASGQYDMALYSWPGSAYPATDARPIFAKPEPAADGSLNVEQNYTRVGTDHIDQLFDQALAELDEGKARDLVRKADARIWAAAGSIPLYQRPQLVAVRPDLANTGAFGFESPSYEDIGFLKAAPAAKK
ncbi:ABC transporter family substrate-binding protein [Streptomyces sp. TRM66268-LWL]|uniref:ABC transporter family substrate-binding protein n=1 Tax=Streptomyces polyasparticus TaxID=2767826 RepID=A0ABR7S6E3_9ACTN|nr:ABC transporter family substrate-binding protein [Streptomyces polyasparticus]MBC9711052.1 ABC transporter family substrate-binding protein [Streptomyces polyasparticus]